MTGQEIKAFRTLLNLSQSELARSLGVSKRTVEAWEQGLRAPNNDNEKKIEGLKHEK